MGLIGVGRRMFGRLVSYFCVFLFYGCVWSGFLVDGLLLTLCVFEAGITYGMDMVGVYMREKFGRDLADLVLDMANVEVRDAEYAPGEDV